LLLLKFQPSYNRGITAVRRLHVTVCQGIVRLLFFNQSYLSTNSTHVHTCPSIHFEQMFRNADYPQQPKISVAARSVKRTSISAILESTVVLPSKIKQLLLLGSGREFSSIWRNWCSCQ